MLEIDDNKIGENVSNDKVDKIIKNLSKSQKSKNNKSKILKYVLNIRAIEESIFLTFVGKKTFNHLKQALIKALILYYFNLESHKQIETNILG